MKKVTKISTLIFSALLLTGCDFKGFAAPIGTPGTAVDPAHVLFYAHVGDQSIYKSEDVTPGKPVSEPDDPEQTGQELFTGWSQKERYETEEDIWNFADSIPVDSGGKTIRFYGQWDLPVVWVNVTFYENEEKYDAFEEYYSVSVKDGEQIPADQMPANPTHESGYEFLGWYAASDSSQSVIDFNFYRASQSSCEFIAKYNIPVAPTYTVTFNVDGSVYKVYTDLHEGDKVPTEGLTNPTKSGYTFLGWSTDLTKEHIVDLSTQVVGNADLSYNAIFEEIPPETVVVSFYDDILDGTLVGQYTVEKNKPLGTNIPADPTKDKHIFLGWSTDGTKENIITMLATRGFAESISLYAAWEADIPAYDTYNVAVELKNEWKESGTYAVAAYAYNSVSGQNNADWPGAMMNFDYWDEVKDVDYYSIAISEYFDTLIFARVTKDGDASVPEMKTVSIPVSKATCDGKYYWMDNLDGAEWKDGGWNEYIQPAKYTLSFYEDVSKTALVTTKEVTEGGKLTDVPAAPSKEGHSFNGWAHEDGTLVNWSTYVINADESFIAKYEAISTFNTYVQVKNAWKEGPTYKVAVYAWNSVTGDKNAEYPGLPAEHVKYRAADDVDFYKVSMSTSYDHYLYTRINEDGTQSAVEMKTADILVNKAEQENKFCWLDNLHTEEETKQVWDVGGWVNYPELEVDFKLVSEATTNISYKFVQPGEQLTSTDVPADPTRIGYKFNGWTLDGESEVDPTIVSINEDTVFYGLWETAPVTEYTIYLQSKDSSWGAAGAKPYIYVWDESDTPLKAWPGEEMTLHQASHYDEGAGENVTVYKYTFDITYTKFILCRVDPSDLTNVWTQTENIMMTPENNGKTIWLNGYSFGGWF